MNDMSSVIIPKSDQINADTLLAGPMTVTIREVQIRGGQEQPVSIMLDETELAYRPCKSMSRVLVQAWGPDAKAYVGRSLTLYRDPTVKWAGMEVGGIRISHMSHIDGKLQMQLTSTKGQRKPHIVMPLVIAAKPSGVDKERDWTDKFIANVNRAPDAAKLDAFVDGKAKLLGELKGARPELHAECETAIAARKATFADPVDDAADDEDDPFAETTDETVSQEMQRKIREQIAAAMNDKGLDAVEAEWMNRHRIAYSPDDQAEIDNLIAAKRRAFAEGEG
jgi:hypothetical protein